MSRSVLHAQFLQHIRSLNLTVELYSPRNDTTSITLSESSDRITLEHDKQSISITLPARISSPVDLSHCLPAPTKLSATTRLQVDPSHVSSAEGEGFHVPWTASALSDGTELRCAACNANLTPRGRVRDWRDLPSEGWAEMMDLWHCHKPHETDADSAAGSRKGFAANSRLVTRNGIGLVDVLGFLLAGGDCPGVKVGHYHFFTRF